MKGLYVVGFVASVALTVTPTRPLQAQLSVPISVHTELQRLANHYPLIEVTLAPAKAAHLVFVDSTFTPEAQAKGAWMFGPPVTSAEADSCPPEKVLGRRIARVLWARVLRQAGVDTVVVEVQGIGRAAFSRVGMLYYRHQLDGPWAGDTLWRAHPSGR